ncbi:MAG TPA: 16S rRNA (cytosine(1402)-N(4))-methyltransferase RsmH [Rubricoccaceae bacterium]
MSRPARPRRLSRALRNASGAEAAATGTPEVVGTGGEAYATGYHAPVLAPEAVAGLVTDPNGLYVDGTLGGGGHSAALLDALGPDALVVGIDQDAEALGVARARLADAEAAGRFVALRGNFADIDRLLTDAGLGPTHGRPAAGVLLDLGVSSRQLDAPARGFAFMHDGPLDMRMDGQAGETAADLVARLSEAQLADTIYAYGEEGRSRRIAESIKRAERMETTADLAAAVRRAVPTRDEGKALARVFLALRIAVNDEMGVLERALPAALSVLARPEAERPGGRLAVMSYHSLEDRRAKHFLRTGRFDTATPERDAFGNPVTPFAPVTRRAVVAGDAEVARNGRARSARLRIAEVAAPAAARL